GRRIESTSLKNDVRLIVHVLINALTTPRVPRSSQGVPGPGAMASKNSDFFPFSDAISMFSGVRILDINLSSYRNAFYSPIVSADAPPRNAPNFAGLSLCGERNVILPAHEVGDLHHNHSRAGAPVHCRWLRTAAIGNRLP